MPTRYRALAKELSETDDLAYIIELTDKLIVDVAQRVAQKSNVSFEIEAFWYLRGEHDSTYQQLPWCAYHKRGKRSAGIWSKARSMVFHMQEIP